MCVCMYMYVCEYVCNLVLGERLYSVSFFKFLIEVRLESVMEDYAREVWLNLASLVDLGTLRWCWAWWSILLLFSDCIMTDYHVSIPSWIEHVWSLPYIPKLSHFQCWSFGTACGAGLLPVAAKVSIWGDTWLWTWSLLHSSTSWYVCVSWYSVELAFFSANTVRCKYIRTLLLS